MVSMKLVDNIKSFNYVHLYACSYTVFIIENNVPIMLTSCLHCIHHSESYLIVIYLSILMFNGVNKCLRIKLKMLKNS